MSARGYALYSVSPQLSFCSFYRRFGHAFARPGQYTHNLHHHARIVPSRRVTLPHHSVRPYPTPVPSSRLAAGYSEL